MGKWGGRGKDMTTTYGWAHIHNVTLSHFSNRLITWAKFSYLIMCMRLQNYQVAYIDIPTVFFIRVR